MNEIEEPDDSEIPESAFTGPAPAKPAKEKSGKPGPTGPACPEGCKDRDGSKQKTWENTTKAKGKPYFRCPGCKGCWWPQKDNPKKIDPASKWPPFDN